MPDAVGAERIRLAQRLVCAACGRLVAHADPTGPHGAHGWFRCGRVVSGGALKAGCDAETFYVVLGRGALGVHVRTLLGDRLAEHVLRAWVRSGTPDDPAAARAVAAAADVSALWAMPVTDGATPAYLLVAARARDRHRHRWASVAEVIRALGIEAA